MDSRLSQIMGSTLLSRIRVEPTIRVPIFQWMDPPLPENPYGYLSRGTGSAIFGYSSNRAGDAGLPQLLNQFERAVTQGEKDMVGLCQWAEVLREESQNDGLCIDKKGEPFISLDLDRIIDALWKGHIVNFKKGDWIVLAHPATAAQIADFCTGVVRLKSYGLGLRYTSKIGDHFPVLRHGAMPRGIVLLVNLSAAGIRFVGSDDIQEYDISEGRYARTLYSFEVCGVIFRNLHGSMGLIYGLPGE